MPQSLRKILPADILADADYAGRRNSLRADSIAAKRLRRIEVGPFATFHFENYQSMWLQVQEMLRIEKGGPEQIAGELEAYNPLIPQGNELVATLMIEIEDAARRDRELRRLGHLENAIHFELDGEPIPGTPTDYLDRTTADGKTSSVHWLRFVFSPEQIKRIRAPSARLLLAISHPNYGHMAIVPDEVRTALAMDFA